MLNYLTKVFFLSVRCNSSEKQSAFKSLCAFLLIWFWHVFLTLYFDLKYLYNLFFPSDTKMEVTPHNRYNKNTVPGTKYHVSKQTFLIWMRWYFLVVLYYYRYIVIFIFICRIYKTCISHCYLWIDFTYF